MAIKRLPPVQWLHTYLSVINAGSFSAAANELHMTQAAVSKQIRQLEHQFGEALFKRHARGVTPTAVGEAIRERVESAFSLLQDIDNEAQPGIKVYLRCDIAYVDAVLSWQLDSLRAEAANIALHISTFVWPDVSRHSLNEIHILLDTGEIPGMKRTPLGPEHSIMVANPKIRENWVESRSSITLLTRIGQEQAWQDWLQSYKSSSAGTEPEVGNRIVSDSSLICKNAALAGQGVALLRYSQVCNELEEGRLVRVDDFVTKGDERFCLYEPDNARADPIFLNVLEWIESSNRNVQNRAERPLQFKT